MAKKLKPEEPEVLPCPFCGGQPNVLGNAIECENEDTCGASVVSKGDYIPYEQWNRRTQ